MRARYPDLDGFVDRDGVKVHYEVYDNDAPTLLLMPSWSITHARVWKAQIPYLARHWRVVVLDGRGNGRSDRPTGPEAPTPSTSRTRSPFSTRPTRGRPCWSRSPGEGSTRR